LEARFRLVREGNRDRVVVGKVEVRELEDKSRWRRVSLLTEMIDIKVCHER